MLITDPKSATPRCTATADLISRFQRPYLFLVTVRGEYPHQGMRQYKIAANEEGAAAMLGIDQYLREFTTSPIIKDMASLSPRAKLQ
jgi:hypothetical protein